MKDIKFVFFDLDHTIWDYETNSKAALIELIEHFGLREYVSDQEFVETYQSVNEKLWHQFNSGEIDRSYIHEHRFPQVLQKLGISVDLPTENLHHFFVENCSNRSVVFPMAHETLDYLKEKYPLALITNGFPEAQYPKMKAAGLEGYFREIIISQEVGFRKPQPEIFHLAMQRLNAVPEQAVMIGDNPKTDIQGAENAGMKAIFFNPDGRHQSVTEWQIQSLNELIDIL